MRCCIVKGRHASLFAGRSNRPLFHLFRYSFVSLVRRRFFYPQGAGKRRWSIESGFTSAEAEEKRSVQDIDVRVLADFEEAQVNFPWCIVFIVSGAVFCCARPLIRTCARVKNVFSM